MRENSFISNFKFIVRLLVFFGCVLFVFQKVGVAYQEAAEKNVINEFTKKRYQEFYALPSNSLDMVFIGSSHAYCTFNPENFKTLGSSSFQMGTPLQHADTTYYALQEIFNSQSPKTVVMELYWDVMDDDFEMKQANSFFEVLENEELKKQYIKDVFPIGEKVKYHLLPMRFQQDYFAYEANEMEKAAEETYQVTKKKAEAQKGEEYYKSKGYVFCNMGMLEGEYKETNQFRELDGRDWEWSQEQKNYLEKIAALCQEKGSELILVTAPIANVSMEYIQHYEKIHDAMEQVAIELGVAYIDYNIANKQENLLTNENFRDDAHLNDSGVNIVDAHFLKWIQEHSVSLRRDAG